MGRDFRAQRIACQVVGHSDFLLRLTYRLRRLRGLVIARPIVPDLSGAVLPAYWIRLGIWALGKLVRCGNRADALDTRRLHLHNSRMTSKKLRLGMTPRLKATWQLLRFLSNYKI